ncbi:hypothetical protein C5167_025419 [Papaver somniferum]|uniref:Uncharacterized protein n=1 Tax=Papaver somniferum TaxID=3469 RepID=A0A4Y7JV69_PAPSO|nr:hypothetical protein C5167_025419 [Papaver somniferum]
MDYPQILLSIYRRNIIPRTTVISITPSTTTIICITAPQPTPPLLSRFDFDCIGDAGGGGGGYIANFYWFIHSTGFFRSYKQTSSGLYCGKTRRDGFGLAVMLEDILALLQLEMTLELNMHPASEEQNKEFRDGGCDIVWWWFELLVVH